MGAAGEVEASMTVLGDPIMPDRDVETIRGSMPKLVENLQRLPVTCYAASWAIRAAFRADLN